MLVQALHSCSSRFPDVAEGVVTTLMDFIGGDGALNVVIFVRAIVEQYPELRDGVLQTLQNSVSDVTKSEVMCITMWILGEYCVEAESIQSAFDDVMSELGEPPFIVVEENKDEKKEEKEPTTTTKNVVLADGTYATQTVYSEPTKKDMEEKMSGLRKLVVEGDIFLCSILASTLTKFCLRMNKKKSMVVKSLLTLCGFAQVASLKGSSQKSAAVDSHERISLCCRMLLDDKTSDMLKETWTEKGKVTFSQLLGVMKEKKERESKSEEEVRGSRGRTFKSAREQSDESSMLCCQLHRSRISTVAVSASFLTAPFLTSSTPLLLQLASLVAGGRQPGRRPHPHQAAQERNGRRGGHRPRRRKRPAQGDRGSGRRLRSGRAEAHIPADGLQRLRLLRGQPGRQRLRH